MMGLSYAPRASVCYIYGTEFLTQKSSLYFGVFLFAIDGVMTMVTPYYFWIFKYQFYYMLYLAVVMTLNILYVLFFIPESPYFLQSKLQYSDLESCLITIAKMNGTDNVQSRRIIQNYIHIVRAKNNFNLSN